MALFSQSGISLYLYSFKDRYANSVPSTTLCTDCFAGLANKAEAVAASAAASAPVSSASIASAVQNKCGSGFGNSVPSTVSEKEANAAATTSSKSSSALTLNFPLAGLAVSAFVTLAGALTVWA